MDMETGREEDQEGRHEGYYTENQFGGPVIRGGSPHRVPLSEGMDRGRGTPHPFAWAHAHPRPPRHTHPPFTFPCQVCFDPIHMAPRKGILVPEKQTSGARAPGSTYEGGACGQQD